MSMSPLRANIAGLALAGGFYVFAVAGARAQQAPSPAPEPQFAIEAFDVEGVKLLKQIDVETAVYPFMGPGRTKADVEGARAALEKVYHDRGYQTVVVQVPLQSAAAGVIRMTVVEAPLGRVRVTGSRYFSPDVIRREASAFKEGEVPNINQAAKEVTDLNRQPDRRVNTNLKAGEAPGTVDVDLEVKDTLPLHGSVELNNDHNQYTTPLRVTGTINYTNLWQAGHSATFTYVVAPEDRSQSEVFAGSYLAPIPNSSFSLLVSGYHSNTNVATIGETTVLGKGYAINFRAIDLLPPLKDWTQSISFGFDYKDITQNVVIAGLGTAAPVAYWPLDFAYNIERDGPKATTKLGLSLTVGLRGLGSNTADYEFARYQARPNFIHVNLDVNQTETLWHGILASQHLLGQISDGPLTSNEQFSAGGLTSTRGYLQSEAIGDEGLSGEFELASPSLAPKWAKALDDLRIYAFTDGAAIWYLQPLPGQAPFYPLSSAGLGLRMEILKHLKGEVAVAVPFLSGPATHADRPRATFSVKSEF